VYEEMNEEMNEEVSEKLIEQVIEQVIGREAHSASFRLSAGFDRQQLIQIKCPVGNPNYDLPTVFTSATYAKADDLNLMMTALS
jgi:hypothetical protein